MELLRLVDKYGGIASNWSNGSQIDTLSISAGLEPTYGQDSCVRIACDLPTELLGHPR